MRPRSNAEVNQFFMCDYGRLNYRWLNRADRVESPLVRQNGADLTLVDWDEALRAAALHLNGKRAFVLASPMLSNESLYMLSLLVEKTGGRGAFRVERGPEAPLEGVDDLALRAERAANVRGAEGFGFSKSDTPLDRMEPGDVLIVADHDITPADEPALAKAASVIMFCTALPEAWREASVVVPATNMAEEEGTFTNLRGRVQRYLQAKAAPGMARPVWWAVADLLAFLGEGTSFFLASEVFAALAAARPEFAGLSYESLGLRGQLLVGAAEVAFSQPAEVGD
jgi:NADH-quinone oxidoreductase subunit G